MPELEAEAKERQGTRTDITAKMQESFGESAPGKPKTVTAKMQEVSGESAPGKPKPLSAKMHEAVGKSAEIAGKMAGVGRQYIHDAILWLVIVSKNPFAKILSHFERQVNP